MTKRTTSRNWTGTVTARAEPDPATAPNVAPSWKARQDQMVQRMVAYRLSDAWTENEPAVRATGSLDPDEELMLGSAFRAHQKIVER